MALGPDVWKATRAELTFLLTANSGLRRDPQLQLRAFHAADSVTMQMPAQIGDYTVSTPAESLNHCFLNRACFASFVGFLRFARARYECWHDVPGP